MERNKFGQFVKGKSVSPDTQFKKGSVPWNKGLKYSCLLSDRNNLKAEAGGKDL